MRKECPVQYKRLHRAIFMGSADSQLHFQRILQRF